MINDTEGPVQDVTREEVKIALSKTSNRKACGPSDVSAELLKALGKYGIVWLHDKGLMEQGKETRWLEKERSDTT